MKRSAVIIGFLLLIGNLLGVAWLLHLNRSQAQPAMLTENQLVQLDKLFEVITNFHNELGNVVGQATYSGDTENEAEEKKNQAKDLLRVHSIEYQVARLDFMVARKSRSIADLSHFLNTTFFMFSSGDHGPIELMGVPKNYFYYYQPMKVDESTGKIKSGRGIVFANLSKLESLHEEFFVLAESMLKDVK